MRPPFNGAGGGNLIRVIRRAIPIERGFALLALFAGDIFDAHTSVVSGHT